MNPLATIASTPLDETSASPLYLQLKGRILQLIATGTLDDANPLPTEQDLCSALGISRATVRRCFKDLVEEGYVHRRRGLGTFVSKPSVGGGLDELYTRVSTSSSIERSGAAAASRILRIRVVKASKTIAEHLALKPGAALWEINRLRLANGTPVVHELAYVPRALCPHLDRADFSHSLYDRIAEESGALPVRTEERIEAVVLDGKEARLLEAQAGAAGMRIIATSYDGRDAPFEASVAIARGDRFTLRTHYASDGAHVQKRFR